MCIYTSQEILLKPYGEFTSIPQTKIGLSVNLIMLKPKGFWMHIEVDQKIHRAVNTN